MNRFILKSEKKRNEVTDTFVRYLWKEVDWSQRLILLLGHRGVGKTTLLLQQMKSDPTKSIYLSLDDYYFEEIRLIEVVSALYDLGYRSFYLDEIHRYVHWSKELKNVYNLS